MAFRSETACIQYLSKLVANKPGTYCQKIYLKFTAGFPDLIVACRGSVAFYEVKPFRTSLEHTLAMFEPIQRATLARMHAAGMDAYGLIVDNDDTAFLVRFGNPMTVKIEDFARRWREQPALLVPWLGSTQPSDPSDQAPR